MAGPEVDRATRLIMATLVVTGMIEIIFAVTLFALPGLLPLGENGALFLGALLLVFATGSIGVALWFRAKTRA